MTIVEQINKKVKERLEKTGKDVIFYNDSRNFSYKEEHTELKKMIEDHIVQYHQNNKKIELDSWY